MGEIHPDAADSTDRVSFTFNRQGEPTTKTDQNGTVHEYARDRFARPTSDTITTLGAGVDGTVLRIDTAYEIRGMIDLITSRAGTAADSTIVNQVLLAYNDFEQPLTEEQDQTASGGPDLTVAYGYEDGSTNTIRPTSIAYPYSDSGSRVVGFVYNTGDDDKLSRVSSLTFTGTPSPNTRYSGWQAWRARRWPTRRSTARSPTARRRILASTCSAESSTCPGANRARAILARLKYGYDPAGNRTFRQDVAATDAEKAFDELYSYDGIQRLIAAARGKFSSAPSSLTGEGRGEGALPPITGPTLQQSWGLDATGNWSGFNSFDFTTAANSVVQLARQRGQRNHGDRRDGRRRLANARLRSQRQYDRDSAAVRSHRRLHGRLGCLEPADGLEIRLELRNVVPVRRPESARMRKSYDGSGTLTESRFFSYSNQWQILEEYLEQRPRDAADPMGLGPALHRRLRAPRPGRQRRHSQRTPLRPARRQLERRRPLRPLSGRRAGAPVERYAYTPYGVAQFLDGDFMPLTGNVSAYAWETLFCGYRYDGAVGLYLVRNRLLLPPLGCWLSRDSLQPASHYSYVTSNPARYIDSLGLIKATYDMHDMLLPQPYTPGIRESGDCHVDPGIEG